jgi:hypothetical protein
MRYTIFFGFVLADMVVSLNVSIYLCIYCSDIGVCIITLSVSLNTV